MTDPEQTPRRDSFAKYSSLGFEMLAAILLGLGLGYALDRWTGTEKPIWTAILTPLITVLTMLRIILKLIHENHDD